MIGTESERKKGRYEIEMENRTKGLKDSEESDED